MTAHAQYPIKSQTRIANVSAAPCSAEQGDDHPLPQVHAEKPRSSRQIYGLGCSSSSQDHVAIADDHIHGDCEIRTDPQLYISLGHELVREARMGEAEACFRMAISLDPGDAMAYNNLGWVLQQKNDTAGAFVSYQRALELQPELALVKRNVANLLARSGEITKAVALWRAMAADFPQDRDLLTEAIESCLKAHDLDSAAYFAARNAALVRGSTILDLGAFAIRAPAKLQAETFLTQAKLQHDLQQIEYLAAKDERSDELAAHEAALRTAEARYHAGQYAGRIALTDVPVAERPPLFNRIAVYKPAPRVAGAALGAQWDRALAHQEFQRHPLGVVVIDDFLSEAALDGLRTFCLDSTIWFANRYAHGRLGAFFREGFNCPLLMQIASELRTALPQVIRPEFPLEQLWAFKYAPRQPATSPHADFAAVNVNFWITPTEANMEPESGGMLISDVEAPTDWSFDDYNRSGNRIASYLASMDARWVNIPYRANRAVMFNSDLFHATAPLHFRPGYENRRINVTMLYGNRRSDAHGARRCAQADISVNYL